MYIICFNSCVLRVSIIFHNENVYAFLTQADINYKILLLLLLLLKDHSPLWTVASNTDFLHSRGSLAISFLFLFPLYLSPLQPHLSICYVVFFSLFIPLSLLQFVLAFFGFAFSQRDHTIPVGGIL